MKSTNKQELTKVIKVERHHFIEVLSSTNNLVTRRQKKETNFEFEDRKENKQILASQQKGLSKTKHFFFRTKPTSNIGTYRIVKQNNNINKTTVHPPQLSLSCTSVIRIGRNLVSGGHALIKASRKNWITKKHPLV